MDIGHARLQKLLDDPSISEIMINGPRKVFAETKGEKVLTDVSFANEAEIMALVGRLFALRGKRLDANTPYSDVCMEDGTRINAIIPPVSRFGVSVTLRKFSKDIRSTDDLLRLGMLSRPALEFLTGCIRRRKNMIISGGTGVGKTTLLQMLTHSFSPNERVITIEDAAELKLPQANVISLETRPADANGKGEIALRDLISNAMRMAPDRLIIGEIRGSEAIDLVQAMSTGHAGTMGILHGNSPREVLARLETMILLSGVALSSTEIRRLIASTIQVIVHVQRVEGRRRVNSITAVDGFRNGEVALQDIFGYGFERMDEHGKEVYGLKLLVPLME